MTTLDELAVRWQHHKAEETKHQAERRAIEDQMVALMKLPPDLDETTTHHTDLLTIKVVGRLDRKVDADKVQEIAAEHGLESMLSALFRWKPEINMRAWNNAPEHVTSALSGAITTKPGRPSFSMSPKKG